MKSVTERLNQYLNTERHFTCADLYELNIRDGGTYYFTDSDLNVSYDGRLYRADFLLIRREQIKLQAQVTVDKLAIKINADKSDTINGKPLNAYAHAGGLDRAFLQLKRLFFDEHGAPLGHVSLFRGVVEIQKGGGIEIAVSVKAATAGLNAQFPRRRYYPQSPYGGIANKNTQTAVIAPFIPTKETLL